MPSQSPKSSPRPPRLQSKGALRPDALYVERRADVELYEALSQGEFCYVLAPRQIGKSSLRLHVARELAKKDGVRCAHIDLSEMGDGDGTDGKSGWYFGLVQKLANDLELDDPLDFWRARSEELPALRFRHYLHDVVLPGCAAHVVVFIDEIDYVRKLRRSFDPDEFFATIRSVANARAEDASLLSLTFCLLGVAAPSDLIADPAVTPFNIGQAIALGDFSRRELDAFAPALQSWPGRAEEWLDAIHDWTSGQPYMTQTLIEQAQHSIRQGPPSVPIAEHVAALVRERFLSRGRADDPNLAYAETRLDSSPRKADMLALYHRLIQGHSEPLRIGDVVQLELQLCGLLSTKKQADGSTTLSPRSRIFAAVFDLDWVRTKESQHRWTSALQRWLSTRNAPSEKQDSLLRGFDLRELETFAREKPGVLSMDEHDFLLASLAEERRAVRDRATADRVRSQRRIVILLSAALVIVVILLAQAVIQYRRAEKARDNQNTALQQEMQARRDAEKAQQLAESRARTEQSMRAATVAQRPGLAYQALVSGMLAASADLKGRSFDPAYWEGLTLAAAQTIASTALKGHEAAVNSAAFSTDGTQVVTGSNDSSARIWDVATHKIVHVLSGHRLGVNGVAFSPDGQHVATASDDGTARIWSATEGRSEHRLEGHRGIVFTAHYSPDGRRIVTASDDATARIWDTQSGRVVSVLQGHRLAVHAAAYSADGRYIVTTSYDATARIWDARNGQLLRVLIGHKLRVLTAAFSPDGQLLVTGCYDGTARIWDVATGKTLLVLSGHRSLVLGSAFSPDGQQVVTSSQDGTARIWDAGSGKLLRLLEGHPMAVNSVAWSTSGRSIVSGSDDHTARIWDLQGPGTARTVRVLGGHKSYVLSGTLSADGQKVLTASYDRTAQLFDVSKPSAGKATRVFIGHDSEVRTTTLSRDGQTVLTGDDAGQVLQWNVDAAPGSPPLRRIGNHVSTIYFAIYSPDGKRLITGGSASTPKLWDVETWNLLQTLPELRGSDWIRSVAFSSDGKWLATGSANGRAGVWDVGRGQQSVQMSGHKKTIRSVAFSPDGTQIATGSSDATARIWDARSGSELQLLRGHSDDLTSVAYTADGARIVTGSEDGTARLWDAKNGHELLVLPTLGDLVLQVAASSDGRTLRVLGTNAASSNASFRVYLEEFLIDPEALYRYGCRVLQGFTADTIPNVRKAAALSAMEGCSR